MCRFSFRMRSQCCRGWLRILPCITCRPSILGASVTLSRGASKKTCMDGPRHHPRRHLGHVWSHPFIVLVQINALSSVATQINARVCNDCEGWPMVRMIGVSFCPFLLGTELRALSLIVFEPAQKGWQGGPVSTDVTQSHQHLSNFRLLPSMNPTLFLQ